MRSRLVGVAVLTLTTALAAYLLLDGGKSTSTAESNAPASPGSGAATIAPAGDHLQVDDVAVSPAGEAPCRRGRVSKSIGRFLAAASKGSQAGLERTVADEPAFIVYSHGLNYGSERTRKFFVTMKRDVLIGHLIRRQAKGDRYSLRSLDVNGFERERSICHLAFTLFRRIGRGPTRPFLGKGALDADSGRIAVWNVGGEPEP